MSTYACMHVTCMYMHVMYYTCTRMCMLCTVHACYMYCMCMCAACTVLYMHVHVMYCTCMCMYMYVPHKWCRRNVPDCQHGMGSFCTVSPRLKWSGQKTCSLNQSEMVGSTYTRMHMYIGHVHVTARVVAAVFSPKY